MAAANNTYEVRLGSDLVKVRISTQFDQIRYAWDTPRHCNAEYELHIVMQGACRLEVENTCCTIPAQHAVVIAPGLYHYPTTDTNGFERFSLSFSVSEGFLRSNLQQKIAECLVFEANDELLRLCKSIFTEYRSDFPYQRELMQTILTELIIRLFRLICPGNERKRLFTTTERVRNELIDDFFSHNFALFGGEDILAKQLNLSKRQLTRVLYQYYGMGFRQKLISTRMDQAAWLLRTTDLRIIEIAQQVGYSSEAAFYQVFRSYFSATPRKYRMQSKH